MKNGDVFVNKYVPIITDQVRANVGESLSEVEYKQ
jgi:hypothetical protein